MATRPTCAINPIHLTTRKAIRTIEEDIQKVPYVIEFNIMILACFKTTATVFAMHDIAVFVVVGYRIALWILVTHSIGLAVLL